MISHGVNAPNNSWETVACLLCGASRSTHVFIGPDRLHGFGDGFSLVRCADCALVYQNPRPTERAIGRFYPSDYLPHLATNGHAGWFAQLAVHRAMVKRIHAVERFCRSGSLLDLGCGSGMFLAAMQRRGWRAFGIDPSETAVEATRRQGVECMLGSLESVDLPEDSLDVVTMWDVVEHLHDPVRTMRAIRRVLRPDGVLLMTTPDLDSVDARLFGRYWAGLDLPRHVVLFDRQTINQLCDKAGFEPIARWYFTGNYHIMRLSVGFAFDSWFGVSGLNRLGRAIVSSPVAWAAYLPIAALCNWLGQGPTMAVAARRGTRGGRNP